MSYLPAGWRSMAPPPMLYVASFKLKSGRAANQAFRSALEKVTSAAVKTKSPVYYLTMAVEVGGKGAPDYILSIPRKSWADFGALSGLWKMMANVYGQANADAIRTSLDDSIAKENDHIDSYDAELSYIAGK
jgi:hypothetical protein